MRGDAAAEARAAYLRGHHVIDIVRHFPAPGIDAQQPFLLEVAKGAAAQGKGIGTTLVREVERELRDRGARMLLVETSSRPDYSNTRAFYARCGYREAARIKDFYAPADDRIMLTTRLTPERGAATR